MRKLMWFAIGFTAGCATGIWLLDGIWLLISAAVLVFFALLFYLIRSPGISLKIAAVLMFGSAVGMCWMYGYESMILGPARSCDGQYMQLQIEVTDYSYSTTPGTAADGVVSLGNSSCKVRFYIEEDVTLSPGDQVFGLFFTRYTGYNARMSPTYHQGKGVFLLAYSEDSVFIEYAQSVPKKYFTAVLRADIQALLDKVFPADTLGFARALLLGDSSLLSTEDDNAFQNSGIRHIIAVSGLHVSILFSFVYMLVGKRRWMTAILGIPVLVMFAALAGFTPSVIRACVMQILMILALQLNKEYDSHTALSFAVLVILVVNPLSLTAVSFQLSVGCVIGIFLFSGKIQAYILSRKWIGSPKRSSIRAKLVRWFAQSVAVSVGAMALTTPLSAHYFGVVSTVSILTNLLTLWVISFIFIGIIIACLAGLIYLPLGSVIAWVVSWPMRYVLTVAKFISGISFSSVSSSNIYILVWLLFCYALVIITVFSVRKHPVMLICCMSLSLLGSLLLTALEYQQDDYRMTVLDVGQGQCLILQSGDSCYVVDCGGNSGDSAADLAVQTLRTQGVEHIDGLILTHFDKDHAGGAESFLSQIDVEALYLPDADPEDELRLSLEENYEEKICWVRRNEYFSCGKAYLTIYPADLGTTGNNSSMCVLFQADNCDILITGDLNTTGEAAFIDSTLLPDIEILVAGHHGSDSSTSMYLLRSVMPDAAVISVGKDNTYGHPTSEVLGRLELFGCRVWRTDLNGTIIFRG